MIAATRYGRPLPDGGTIGVAAAAYETYATARVETPSLLMRAARLLSGPAPFVLRLLGKRTRRVAAASAIAGSLLTRLAWIEAGRKSATKYSAISRSE